MYERKDKYFKQAKQEGFRARSSYKLLEIQKKYKVIKKKDRVLDIGCAPGSWLQVIKKFTDGEIIGIDLVRVKKIPCVKTIKGDITDPEITKNLGKFNAVLSDIAPKTSGNKELDQYKSLELSKMSFQVAKNHLKKGGNFVVKTFQSQETEELVKEVKKCFSFVKRYVPKATRMRSKEIYVIGIDFKT